MAKIKQMTMRASRKLAVLLPGYGKGRIKDRTHTKEKHEALVMLQPD